MTDYISREVLLKGRNELLCHDVKCGECHFSGYGAHPVCELSERIDRVPAADVAPVVHAKWVENDNGTWSCERCHSWIPNEQHHYALFCLYCGARMDIDGEA